jgi:hypothetical protein
MVLELDLPEVQRRHIPSRHVSEQKPPGTRSRFDGQDGARRTITRAKDTGCPLRGVHCVASTLGCQTQRSTRTAGWPESDRVISTGASATPHPENNRLDAIGSLWVHRSDAFKSLVEGWLAGQIKFFNHLKLYLEMTGDYVPTQIHAD